MNTRTTFQQSAADIASRSDRRAALALLQEHPAPSEFSGIDRTTLRLWADVAYTADRFADAERIYAYLIQAEPGFDWLHFQLGRIKLAARKHKEAAGFFSKAASLAPKFAWSWYELSRCYLEEKDAKNLARAVQGFAVAEPVSLSPPHAKVLTAAAHYLFEHQVKEESFHLYKLLIDQKLADDLVRTRHAEYFLSKRDFAKVVELLEPLRQHKTLGEWGLRALGRAYVELDKLDEARPILSDLVKRKPRNAHFLEDYLRVLHRQDRHEEAATTLAAAKSHVDPAVYESLHITSLAERANPADLLEILDRQPTYGGEKARHALLAALRHAAYKQKDYSTALHLIDRFIRRFGAGVDVLMCRIDIAFATRAWDDARKALDLIDDATYESRIELRIKRFEYHCFAGQLAEAAEALRGLEPLEQLAKSQILPVLRYFAESNNWPAAYELSLRLLDAEFDFEHAAFTVLRAVRKTGQHKAAIKQIEAVSGLEQIPALKRLRTILIEDQAYDGSALAALVGDPYVDQSEAIQQRLAVKSLVLRTPYRAPSKNSKKKYAIYFCTNKNYLCATFVSLNSLIESNYNLVGMSDIFIVTDDDCATAANRVITKLQKRANAKIKLLTRTDIVDPAVSLKGAYGLFTGGQSLAEAAYYRIYFASLLQGQRQYERALYVDSDTVVRGDLAPLFDQPLRAPLSARLEDDRSEVRAAIKANNLQPGTYFNSGILLFDLKHKKLRAALEKTMHAVQHSRDTLIFQDQCALNIGFEGVFTPLDPKFNFFVKPQGSPLSNDAAIMHYIDRPKPWDPIYAKEVSRYWFSAWHNLAKQIGGEDAMLLYSMANVA